MSAAIETLYPAPRETPDNAPMLRAWRETGTLLLQRCGGCGKPVFYPRAQCPHCWSSDLGWFEATGRGTVRTYTLIHRGLPEPFAGEAPIVLAEIDLDEGVAMIARIIHPVPDGLRTGDRVTLLAPERARKFPLPTFEPQQNHPAAK